MVPHSPWRIAIIGALVVAACSSGDDRPELTAWETEWSAASAVTPEPIQTEADLTESMCDTLLTTARGARPALLPTPDAALDGPVDAWVVLAESIGFDCHRHPNLSGAVLDLRAIVAEVDAGVRALGG